MPESYSLTSTPRAAWLDTHTSPTYARSAHMHTHTYISHEIVKCKKKKEDLNTL